jgi:hypothetical protein
LFTFRVTFEGFAARTLLGCPRHIPKSKRKNNRVKREWFFFMVKFLLYVIFE